MTNTQRLIDSLYSLVFFSENVNVILVDNESFNADEINETRTSDYYLIKNKEILINTYNLVKKHDAQNEILELKDLNIDEIIEEIGSLKVIKHDFSNIFKFNLDIKDRLETILNVEIDSLHIIVLEKVMLEKLKDLYKSVIITNTMSSEDIIVAIKNAYQAHKEKKFKMSLLHNMHYMNNEFNKSISSKDVEIKSLEDIKKMFLETLMGGSKKLLDTSKSKPKNNIDSIDNLDDISIEDVINDQYKILNAVKCTEKFEDIIGLDKIKKQLQKLALLYKEDANELAKHKISRDKGFILYGEPGTGKTMLCKAFSNVMNGIFIYLSMEQFISKRNEEMSIAKLFEEVEMLSEEYSDQNIVLFLDEIDSLRGRGKSEHNNSYYDGFTNEMLYRIDNLPSNVMIIGATNNLKTLDEALIRKGRLGNQYEVKNDFTKDQIIAHIKNYFNDAKMGILNKHGSEIATMIYYMNGSEIANITNKIKQNYYFKKKFKEKGSLREMIVDTIYSEKYNLADYKLTEEEELSTAYHEAGHALMYMNFYGIKKLHEISIYPTSKTLGFVSYKFDKNEVTKDDLKKLTLIALAGRYAEKLITKNISTGAISDLEKANSHIETIVSKYGMGSIENINKDRKNASDYMLTKLDKEHEELLKLYSEETEKIINENKDLIEEIAKDLVKNKVLIDTFDKYENKIQRDKALID